MKAFATAVVRGGNSFGRFRRSMMTGSSSSPEQKLAVLCILDGWGYRETMSHNAVLIANTPNFDALFGVQSQRGLVGFLDACEREVGLPDGQIGNSEVGHMNIGAGRIVWQDLVAIDNSIETGDLPDREALRDHIDALKRSGGICHLLGLVSPGGVHSTQNHVAHLANAVHRAGVPVLVHAFTDGRDVPPCDAKDSIPSFLDSLDDGVRVATVSGRYYAMDRDHRWERVGMAYDVIVGGAGVAPNCESVSAAIEQAYDDGLTDEFVLPTVVLDGYEGVSKGDGVLMANFRADRAREIMTAIAAPNAPDQIGLGRNGRREQPELATVAGMVTYSDAHAEYMTSLFPPKDIRLPLGEVVSRAGLTQLRTAETEKYPHVTFFFNGGREDPFPGEERILVPSPKVATYDLQPEMSAPEVGRRLCDALDMGKYDLAVVNFANPDMVGHTGDLNAAVKAVETVDACLGDLVRSVEARRGALVVTADHGNCEKMWEEATGEPHTAHTLNRVPVILKDFDEQSAAPRRRLRRSGRLADLAPTILELLDVNKPVEMTGESLIETGPFEGEGKDA
eukprot:g4013.t1